MIEIIPKKKSTFAQNLKIPIPMDDDPAIEKLVKITLI
jgi:hypothetical protein